MGTIRSFDIARIKSEYQLKHFVETGTSTGGAISHCMQFGFKTYSSVELLQNVYEQTLEKFRENENVFLYCGESFRILPQILKKISEKEKILFWLDAHLPSVYSNEYNRSNLELEFPLEKELFEITKNRNFVDDYFIIDDLRIYENGNYHCGNAPLPHKHPMQNDIKFVEELFIKTHEIIRDSRGEGYLILIPKSGLY